ncbi:MAG: cytidine deaminase [Clostridia bacterium]|nr:cytidine deaminase [Clostridia bacterium]
MTAEQLLNCAIQARERAYAPYSRYRVGAALLGADGTVYTGCNIENAAYPATVCAERTALFKAVSEGCRQFSALAVVGGAEEPDSCAYPCGVCRQVLSEFCPPEMPVYLLDGGHIVKLTLGELLPHSFSAAAF